MFKEKKQFSKFKYSCLVFKARRHRNELLHNASFEISEDKLCEYLSDFRDVLEVKNNSNERCFTHPAVEQSLKAFNDVSIPLEIHIFTWKHFFQA
jgi:hypothetical protein